MIIIGEKLNSSIPKTLEALERHNEVYFIQTIKLQEDCGADYIDINTALTREREEENMLWLISLVLEHSKCGLMLDSPKPEILLSCLDATSGRKVILNSISLDDKFVPLISAAKQHGAGLVCLPMTSGHIPSLAMERAENAQRLVRNLLSCGIGKDKIYVDILVEAAATNPDTVKTCLETQELINRSLPDVKTVCGLSNISFGLPGRADINSTFLAMSLSKGLSAAIIDITGEKISKTLKIYDALTGSDEYCIEYISYCRST